MFELADDESGFPWLVKVSRPNKKNPGTTIEQKFEVIFKEMPQDELKSRTDKSSDSAQKYGDVEFCEEIVIGWKDVMLNGEPADFNQANLKKLLNKGGVARAIVDAYLQAISGLKIKN